MFKTYCQNMAVQCHEQPQNLHLYGKITLCSSLLSNSITQRPISCVKYTEKLILPSIKSILPPNRSQTTTCSIFEAKEWRRGGFSASDKRRTGLVDLYASAVFILEDALSVWTNYLPLFVLNDAQ